MKTKLVLMLLLLVVLPLVALTWFGLKLAQEEQERIERRFDDVLSERLGERASLIARLLAARHREIHQVLTLRDHSVQRFRDRIRDVSFMEQIFVVNPKGRLLYPDPHIPLTRAEANFLTRTEQLFTAKDLFYRPVEVETKSSVNTSARNPTDGWYVWYWQNGLRLLSWRRLPDGRLIGAEVGRAQLLSEIIIALPDLDRRTGESESIRLLDTNGNILHQWGEFDPPAKTNPRVTRSLPAPLVSWSLVYFTGKTVANPGIAQSSRFAIALGLSALAIVLVGVATYIYRESQRDAREAARRVDFVSQVSHELKTPLTNIRMYAELLQREVEGDDEKAGRFLDVIVSESQRLSRLIANVLTFSAHNRNALELHRSDGYIDELVEKVLGQFSPSLEGKGIQVNFEGAAKQRVSMDADVIGQILSNLLSNVEKYAAGTGLRISSSQTLAEALIVVHDGGPGIPASQSEKIFAPFYRLSDRLDEGVSGSGIGLALARRLARLHGGDLSLVPSAVGARFELRLAAPLVEKPM